MAKSPRVGLLIVDQTSAQYSTALSTEAEARKVLYCYATRAYCFRQLGDYVIKRVFNSSLKRQGFINIVWIKREGSVELYSSVSSISLRRLVSGSPFTSICGILLASRLFGWKTIDVGFICIQGEVPK